MITMLSVCALMATSWMSYICLEVLSAPPDGASDPLVPGARTLGWLLVIVSLYLLLRIIIAMRWDFLHPIDTGD